MAPPFARRERAALCDLLDRVGPDTPTLSGSWTTYDLAAHLVLRESSPLAATALVPGLGGLNDKAMERLKSRRSYARLVQAVRDGPPWYSPMRPAVVDRSANALEFFVHHEDVRRAGPEPAPRELPTSDQHLLWLSVRRMGRLLARGARVGVELVRTDVSDSARIRHGEPTLVVRGLPAELALFAYGRGTVADVEIGGVATPRRAPCTTTPSWASDPLSGTDFPRHAACRVRTVTLTAPGGRPRRAPA